MRLQLLVHALRARQERVLPHRPHFAPTERKRDDITDERGREEQLAGTREGRHGHLGAADELLHAEFDFAFHGYGGGHGDHGAGLD